jgi:hypothetical protein
MPVSRFAPQGSLVPAGLIFFFFTLLWIQVLYPTSLRFYGSRAKRQLHFSSTLCCSSYCSFSRSYPSLFTNIHSLSVILSFVSPNSSRNDIAAVEMSLCWRKSLSCGFTIYLRATKYSKRSSRAQDAIAAYPVSGLSQHHMDPVRKLH